jgi:hypothetical protein
MNADRGLVIVDDGQFYIQLNAYFEAYRAPGFLQRRCYVSKTTPSGYECIGSFERNANGAWEASIAVPYDEVTCSSSRCVGRFTERMGAIVALWGSRREARCRYRG